MFPINIHYIEIANLWDQPNSHHGPRLLLKGHLHMDSMNWTQAKMDLTREGSLAQGETHRWLNVNPGSKLMMGNRIQWCQEKTEWHTFGKGSKYRANAQISRSWRQKRVAEPAGEALTVGIWVIIVNIEQDKTNACCLGDHKTPWSPEPTACAILSSWAHPAWAQARAERVFLAELGQIAQKPGQLTQDTRTGSIHFCWVLSPQGFLQAAMLKSRHHVDSK